MLSGLAALVELEDGDDGPEPQEAHSNVDESTRPKPGKRMKLFMTFSAT
jgi:hypothetical protein